MKHSKSLFILLIISLALSFTACGGGGDDEETEEILDIFENTEWYFYDNDAIDTYNSIRVLYNRKVYIPFSYLSSNYIFTVVGNREVHYDLESYGSGPELHFTIDGLVVNNYVTTIKGSLSRNRWGEENHVASPDYAYIYGGLGVDAENAETYTGIIQNCVKKGGHVSNPFIGTTWEAGGGETFYFRDDKVCLFSGIEYEYQLTMVPTEDNQATLFLIRNKDYGDSGYTWNGFQYIPVNSFSIKGKYSDFNNLLQITEEITANVFDRN